MDILGEWLSTTIHRDLCQVLEHNPTESRVLYEDDGSNIRIGLSVEGIVQIIKVSRNHSRYLEYFLV